MPIDLSSISNYTGLKVTVLGLGTFGGGVAVVRFLASQGAVVTITDLRSEQQLAESLQQLEGVPIHATFLGSHPEAAFDKAQLLIVNPAVRPDNETVARCRQKGTVVASEIELFLKHNSARVIGVTGSNGKSTTVTLIQRLMEPHAAANDYRVWLGGNIGTSLLPAIDDIAAQDVVVLELSSFQLHSLKHTMFAPEVAVITNFAPNHLDWHGTLEHYRSSKQVLLQRQRPDDVAILPDDPDCEFVPSGGISATLEWRVRGHCLRFGVRDVGEDGAFFEHGSLILRRGRSEDAVRIDPPAQLPGLHNHLNIAAAACAAWTLGADPDGFNAVLANYTGLPHRLQLVAAGRDLQFYNDSLATTPESAIAALHAFRRPCVIIAGGSDKGADLSPMATQIHQRTVGAVLIGETAGHLARHLSALTAEHDSLPVHVATDFEDAFRRAVALAPQGGIVLLSPGCASYGWFRDFRERGDRFTQLAHEWIKE